MNILLLNTYPHGGAGTACSRLQLALQQSGQLATMLTSAHAGSRWPFFAERLSFLPFERNKSVRFSFSLANFGHDLTKHPLVAQADILHLHWVNQGFLSLRNIQQLVQTGKPVVWTLHDMWAFTGGCHYSGDCRRYENACGYCPFLRRRNNHDLSNRIWRQKKVRFSPAIQFIACSDWLAGVARESGLLKDYPVISIPNAIDTDQFKPSEISARQEFRRTFGIPEKSLLLLFAAMKITEDRKGFRYLFEALCLLKKKHPEIPVELLVIGQSNPQDFSLLPYPTHALGLIKDTTKLVEIYAAADAFVIPSLEDNLPNTVMESLACGTPVIGFDTGGIPQMVNHLAEGFIAPQRDSESLAAGIRWLFESQDSMTRVRLAAREKAVKLYANPVIAAKHISLYQRLIEASNNSK